VSGRLALVALVALACGRASAPVTLYTNGFDGPDPALTKSGVTLDSAVYAAAPPSLRVDAEGPAVTVRIAEVPLMPVSAEKTVLTYRAKLRAENVGKAYLELWVRVPGAGEFFSRALHAPLSGTVDWTSQETPFFLDAGQAADLAKLNLVVEGGGRVWIDDASLLRARP
jgi:hypothetical protein